MQEEKHLVIGLDFVKVKVGCSIGLTGRIIVRWPNIFLTIQKCGYIQAPPKSKIKVCRAVFRIFKNLFIENQKFSAT